MWRRWALIALWVLAAAAWPSLAFAMDARSAEIAGAAATIPTGASTAVTFSAEVHDEDGMATLASASDRLTVQTAGHACVSFYVMFASNTAGNRIADLIHVRTGSFTRTVSSDSAVPVTALSDPRLSAAWCGPVAVGDYFRVTIFQNSGAARSLSEARLAATVWLPTSEGGGGEPGPTGPAGPPGPTGPPGEACPTPQASGEVDCSVEISTLSAELQARVDLWFAAFVLVAAVVIALLCAAALAVVTRRG